MYIGGLFCAILRCRQSEYTKYSSILRLVSRKTSSPLYNNFRCYKVLKKLIYKALKGR